MFIHKVYLSGVQEYFKQEGALAACYIYRPAVKQNVILREVVTRCCDGWGGPNCNKPEQALGHCIQNAKCIGKRRDAYGFVTHDKCCKQNKDFSWQANNSTICYSCIKMLDLTQKVSSPAMQKLQNDFTCYTWSGLHYKTFDGKFYSFNGTCSYRLAMSADGSW